MLEIKSRHLTWGGPNITKSNKPLPLSEIAPPMMSDDISKIRKNRISLLSKQDQSIFELLIKISVKDEL